MIKPKLKKVKQWNWVMEDDVPLTWSKEELATMRFKCSRKNFLFGNLPESMYRKEVELYRSRNE